MTVHPFGFVDETDAWRARVAAEVAARYGVAVAAEAVSRIDRGASGLPQVKWDGRALVYDAPAGSWRKAAVRHFQARSLAVRLGVGPGIETQKRRDEVARLHGLGLYDAQIVAQIGVCLTTVRHIRCELGLVSNGHLAQQAVAAARVARVVDMLQRGFSPAVIAAQEGLKEASVKSIGRERLGMSFPRVRAAHVIANLQAAQARALARVERLACQPHVSDQAKAVRKMHRPRAECDAIRLARQQSVAALAAEGFSQRDIAKKLGVSPRTVSGDLAAAGLTCSHRQGHYYPRTTLIEAMEARRAAVLGHLRRGANCPSIARLLGCNKTSVREDRAALIASGAFDPATAPLTGHRQRRVQVLAMLQQGLGCAEIAAALGVGVSTIRDDCRALIAGGAVIGGSARGRKKAAEQAVADA